MAQACEQAGYITHRSNFDYYFDAGSPRFNPGAYAALVREGIDLARHHQVRVLHANSAAPTQWLLPVARRLRLPLLTHLHIDYLRRSRYALLLHLADSVIGVSRQVNEDLIRDGVPKARTRVIYNGIDFARLTAQPGTDLRARLGIAPDAVAIGAVGSLIRRKGHDVLLRAMAQLAGTPAPHLLVASDGPEREALMRLSHELGISNRTHFLGYHDPITDLYATCDIMALASRADAFGLVLAEAGFSHLPVVATSVGGIPEVVLDGETGLLVPPDNPDALAHALSRLVDDPALRQRMGEAGRIRAEQVFSAPRMAAEFHVEYDRLAVIPRTTLGWANAIGKSQVYAKLLAHI
jgi:glycosyltransferase involved in cell wall biosynthesis